MSIDEIISVTEWCIIRASHLLRLGQTLRAERKWLEQQTMLLQLWAAQLGIFAQGDHSIRYRCRRNATVVRAILQLLTALREDIQSIDTDGESRIDATRGSSLHRPPNEILARSGHGNDNDEDEIPPQNLPDHDFEFIVNEPDAVSDTDASSDESDTEFTQDEKTEQLQGRITGTISDLMRLANSIRSQNSARRKLRGDTYEPKREDFGYDSDDDEFSDPSSGVHVGLNNLGVKRSYSARFDQHIDHVLRREMGPTFYEQAEQTFLVTRLHDLMLKRWRRLCYNHAHAKRLHAPNKRQAEPAPREMSRLPLATDTNVAQHESDMFSKTEQKRPASQTSRSAATTLPTVMPSFRAARSQASSSKATSRVDKIELDLPPMPASDALGSEYIFWCPYCCTSQRTTKPLTAHRWRLHLQKDLRPYICLHKVCDTGAPAFASELEWRDHIMASHYQTTWSCRMCAKRYIHESADEAQTLSDFHSEEALLEHFRQHHGHTMKDEEMAVLARYSRKATLSACLICDSSIGITPSTSGGLTSSPAQGQENILKCMAIHLESMSISCIPWQFGRSLTARSSQAQATNEAQSLQSLGASLAERETSGYETGYDADSQMSFDDEDKSDVYQFDEDESDIDQYGTRRYARPLTQLDLDAPDLQPIGSDSLVSDWITGVRRSDPRTSAEDAYESSDETIVRRFGRPRAYALSGGEIQPPSPRFEYREYREWSRRAIRRKTAIHLPSDADDEEEDFLRPQYVYK